MRSSFAINYNSDIIGDQFRATMKTPIHHNTIVLGGFKRALIGLPLCIETLVFRTADGSSSSLETIETTHEEKSLGENLCQTDTVTDLHIYKGTFVLPLCYYRKNSFLFVLSI